MESIERKVFKIKPGACHSRSFRISKAIKTGQEIGGIRFSKMGELKDMEGGKVF